MRICKTCGCEKAAADFYPNRHICKTCIGRYYSNYRRENYQGRRLYSDIAGWRQPLLNKWQR